MVHKTYCGLNVRKLRVLYTQRLEQPILILMTLGLWLLFGYLVMAWIAQA